MILERVAVAMGGVKEIAARVTMEMVAGGGQRWRYGAVVLGGGGRPEEDLGEGDSGHGLIQPNLRLTESLPRNTNEHAHTHAHTHDTLGET